MGALCVNECVCVCVCMLTQQEQLHFLCQTLLVFPQLLLNLLALLRIRVILAATSEAHDAANCHQWTLAAVLSIGAAALGGAAAIESPRGWSDWAFPGSSRAPWLNNGASADLTRLGAA